MRKRPLLRVALVPSTPMKDETLSTAGSRSILSARARWRAAISWNDTVGPASVMAWMKPVSCKGKKPLGMAAYITMVRKKVPIATAMVSLWCRSTQTSLRS
jgi:hypothetical protein